MTRVSRGSKVKVYFGISMLSFIVGLTTFLYAASTSKIPREYILGNFQLDQIVTPSNVFMIAKLEPEFPTTFGEEIHITVFSSDDMQPLSDRIIIVKDRFGDDVGGGITNSTGQAVITYPGAGTIIRITSDGSYIRDAIIFLPVEQEYVNATILLYLGSIVAGVAVGIGFHFLFKRIQWL